MQRIVIARTENYNISVKDHQSERELELVHVLIEGAKHNNGDLSLNNRKNLRNVCADIVTRGLPYDGEIREASILQ
jgi:hypothetical protein